MYGEQEMHQLSPSGSMSNEGQNGLTYIDFLPHLQKPKKIFTNPVYENFRALLDRANEWLLSYPEWDIVTCESIELKTKGDRIKQEDMLYVERSRVSTWYVRGLRLWIKACRPGEERSKQVGYLNVVPEEKISEGLFSSPVYETLDELIDRYNYNIRNAPIPGRIITIETQGMKIKSSGSFDPDRSSWREGGNTATTFLFIVRIFFEVSEPGYEEIGLTDFLPENISNSCFRECIKYEPLSNALEEAAEWCSRQSLLRICNIQAVVTKLKSGEDPQTRKTSYAEWGRFSTFFMRIVRVAHVKRQPHEDAEFNSYFTCKNFAPVKLISKRMESIISAECTKPKFETLPETMSRVSAWIKATGVNVINMETTEVHLDITKGADYSADESFFYDIPDVEEYFIYVIRVYINGRYYEPPEGTLPPIPETQTKGCSIL